MTGIGSVDPGDFASRVLASLDILLRQFNRTDLLGDEFTARIRRFADTLAIWGRRINLTAEPNDSDEIAFHIADSLMPLILADTPSTEALGEAFAQGRQILDFGSGSGFPGLILASALAAQFMLVEARRKRASFLKVVAAEMRLDNVEIENRRLDLERTPAEFDTMVVRAVGASSNVYQAAARMLREHGMLVLYASASQKLNLDAAAEVGLVEPRKFSYEIRRRKELSRRILAVLTRS